MEYKNKSILITGGTGSLGYALTEYFLKNHPELERLIIFSRDEQKQFKMAQLYPPDVFKQIRFFIGDVRDKDRLIRAINQVDYVIHAAAMKHVPIAEYNPNECIKTNVGGAQNLIEACLSASSCVSRVVALSTDKACAPINLYGATKLTSDKMFVAANNFSGKKDIKFSVVRYGNVFGSNGSVVPYFLKMMKKGVLNITDKSMTRFNISIEGGVEMVINALENAWGGELFVPKIPSYRITDLATAICEKCKIKIIGIRPGEKVHEEMISSSDSYNSYDLGKYYVILPTRLKWNLSKFIKEFKAIKIPKGFSYNSGKNDEWLDIKQLKKLIIKFKNEKTI
tara:strand:+ start:25539 stop:26555 length:1017 start_codon:yes stop_codon:yes gene_type:complete